MKRTGLQRGSSQLKRTALKQRSSKKARTDREWPAVRAAVIERDGGMCQALVAKDCTGRAEHVHHIVRRSQGGLHDMDDLVSLCRACHDYCHSEVAWSVANGFLRRSHLSA